MHPADILRVVVGIEQSQKGRYSPARRRILTLAGGEGAGDHRKERAINERITVDQKQSRAVRTFHEVNIKRPRPSLNESVKE